MNSEARTSYTRKLNKGFNSEFRVSYSDWRAPDEDRLANSPRINSVNIYNLSFQKFIQNPQDLYACRNHIIVITFFNCFYFYFLSYFY